MTLFYSLFKVELKILQIYFDKHLKNDFIKFFIFSIDASILFVKKKNEILKFCVNYRSLNLLTIKNRYLLSLIDESLNRLSKIRVYTSLNMIATYNRLRIKRDDEWKTTFKTRYKHFEYIVLFFDLTNAFATFQSFVNKILIERLNFIVIIYLNDIVIYFNDMKQHIENVKWILSRLRDHKLFINMKKCKFFKNNIDFLNFVVFFKNVQMQEDKIEIIQQWSASKNVFEILKFLRLCNFYRRFIKNFNKIILSLIEMLKRAANLHKKETKRKRDHSQSRNKSRSRNNSRSSNNFLIFETYKVFKRLRKVFQKASILQHFDSIKRIRVKIDVSNKTIDEIFCQSNDKSHWHSIIYFSRKMISTKCNYEIHDKKLLIIIFAFKQWRHYFEKARKQILILTNHRNLNRFMSTTKLSFRQIRWIQKLSRYNFVIDYRSDNKNFANDLFRRSDHMTIIEKKIENNRQMLIRLREFLQTNSVEFRVCVSEIQVALFEFDEEINFANDLFEIHDCAFDEIIDEWKIIILNSASIFRSINEMTARKHIQKDKTYDDTISKILFELIRSLLEKDSYAMQIRQELITFEMSLQYWQDEKKVLWHDECLYISSNLKKNVIKVNHDNSLIEHFDVKRILKLIQRKYYWSNQNRNVFEKNVEHDFDMRTQIKEYCETCAICKRNKAFRHKSYDKLSSLSISKFK